ncbi:MAG: S8 family serine peptidase [Clostridia bacterium]|nr:S8 family serine peptidase [Clostridia bacterium]
MPKTLIALLLSALLLVPGFSPAFAAGEKTGVSLTPVDPASLAVERLGEGTVADQAEPARDPDEIVRVSVFFKSRSALEAGFSLKGVGVNAAAVSYRESLLRTQDRAVTSIEAAVGHKVDVRWNLTLLANAVSMNVRYGDVEAIRALPNVKSVELETLWRPEETEAAEPAMTDSYEMLESDGEYSSAYKGAGERLAIIDTGLDIEHQSFDEEAFLYAIAEDEAEAGRSYDLLTEEEVELLKRSLNAKDGVYLNAKIPFAYNYVDRNTNVTHVAPGDFESEHGSHVAGISAANRYLKRGDTFVDAAETVRVVGQAPDAQVLVMKVFGVGGGAYDSDYFAAVEDAIALGAASANLSLSSGTPGVSVSDSYQAIIDSLAGTEFVMVCSMGNNSSWDSHTHLYADDVNLMAGGMPGAFTNAFAVASAYDSGYETGETDLPGAKVYTMSGFSAWGVPGALTLKPEITAPGGSVYSLNGLHRYYNDNLYGGHDAYEYMSGTSMAAPQITGLVAALAGRYKADGIREKTGLTLRQYAQGALMSTAVPIVDPDTGYYYSILKQGSGIANLNAATGASSVIVMDENASRTAADGKVKAELGDDPARTGVYTYSFTVMNLSDEDRTFTVRTDVFTQALSEDGKYMEHEVTPLDMTATVLWDGAEPAALSADVNGDGFTDLSDVDAILSIAAGLSGDFDLAAADYDADGEVTTRDARLLSDAISEANAAAAAASVPAGQAGRATVTIRLTDAQKQILDAERAGGAYIEAYTFVESETDMPHSIPVLGFYGSWTDASMFDAVRYEETLYDNGQTSYFGAEDTNGWRLKSAATGKERWYVGNPYLIEDTFPADKLAIRTDETLHEARYTLIRPMAGGAVAVLGGDGEVLYSAAPVYEIDAAYYQTQASPAGWRNTRASLSKLDRTPASLGLAAGDTLTFGYFAFPAYYSIKLGGNTGDEHFTKEMFKTLLASGDYGKGAYIGYTVTLDDVSPVILGAEQAADGGVTIRFTDDRYVACLKLLDVAGQTTLLTVAPDSAPGAENTFTFDPAALGLTNAVNVFVADYAGNETAALLRFAPGDVVAERAVYALTDALEPGEDYVIAPTAEYGVTHALARGYATAGRDSVIVWNADAPYILASDVDETAVWTAVENGGLLNGGYYLTALAGELRFTSESGSAWRYENGSLGTDAGYIQYVNNAYSLGGTPAQIKIFKKTIESTVVLPASAASPAAVKAKAPAARAETAFADTLTLPLTVETDALNALLRVTYDQTKLTYVGADLPARAAISAEPGQVTIALVAAPAVPAGEALAEIRFTGGCEDEEAALAVLELNDTLTPAEAETVTVPGAGHAWGAPEWTWTGSDEDGYTAASALFTCENDPSHSFEAEAEITVETTPATSAAAGKTVYRAEVTGPDGEPYTDEKTVAIEKLDPDYELTGFVWADDYLTAEAVFVDHNNLDAETRVAARVTAETTPATSVSPGKTVYTASVTGPDGEPYADVKEVVLPQLDPDYEFTGFVWQAEAAAEAVFVDHNNHNAETRVPANVTSETTPATCAADGLRIDHASVVGPDGETYEDSREMTLSALGHAWGAPEWTFTDDLSAATAAFTCGNDATHAETVTVATARAETAPTCTAAGSIRFTAAVTGPDGKSYTETRTLTVDALGHDRDQNGVCRRCGDGATTPGENEGGACKYCGEVHDTSTLSGRWLRIVHAFLYLMQEAARFFTSLV